MIQKVKNQKTTPKKNLISDNWELKERLTNARIVQKDLLYVIGLSPKIANKTVLFNLYFLDSWQTRVLRPIWKNP